MKYSINRENYHRFDILELGKLPARSYFIPFADRAAADGVTIGQKRYASTKVQCLNGQWDFLFFQNPKDVPLILDTDRTPFDTIDVPSCWQFRGYDRPFYVNSRYQFPFDPPKVPMEEAVGKVFCVSGSDYGIRPRWQTPQNEYNFVGIYRKKLSLADTERTRIISFLGVASCLDLYVNGSFVGYSEGSHNTAEFDLTAHLHPGENELVAVVHRWCTGTYLECQDMFRNNGIFRDVLLYELDKSDFWDIEVKTQNNDGAYRAEISVELLGDERITVTLTGHGFTESQSITTKDQKGTVIFEPLKVAQWSAETPFLYDLYLETAGSCVKLRVGFKDVRIQGDVFTLNGQKLKLKGVNHHDTSCTNGYYLTPKEIEQDVRLCKQYNIDTIRTSHYPPDPMLLEWCDELGIYVVDEADLETHGVLMQQFPPNFNTLTQDVRWQNRYLDRVCRLYGRDKNYTSILMWSLGNESGGYRNTDAMYHWLKQRTALPIHYESAIHSKRVCYDVGSEMYPSIKKVHQVGTHSRREKELNDRPYFLCEYAHAMGVGPGAVEEYWQEIYAYDNLMGGCVWEMVDHAVLHCDGSYTYGGDHGEWEHDRNFCVDGLFYPNRTPSTGAKIIRHVYRPIRVNHISANTFEVFNTTAFTPGSSYRLTFLFASGREETRILDVSPLTREQLQLSTDGEKWVTVVVVDIRSGKEMSKEQILFDLQLPERPKTRSQIPSWMDFKDGKLTFCKDGKTMTTAQCSTLLFRAPTDNDVDFFNHTAMDDYLLQREEVLNVAVDQEKLVVTSRITCRKQVFLCTDRYESCDSGILVTSQLHCVRGRGKLPRFAKTFRLPERFDSVQYVGRNGESYRDMKEHTQVAEVCCSVTDMTEPNIRPQESGNRCDCSYASISDGETAFSFTAVEKAFELGVKPYSDWELLSMKHRKDEQRTGTYVTISAFQMGIGTGSCGPVTLPEYCFDVKNDYTLQFIIT